MSRRINNFSRMVSRQNSVVPNRESTARDHLANERTFLAWCRTGLAFVGLGLAVDSLERVINSSSSLISGAATTSTTTATKITTNNTKSNTGSSVLEQKLPLPAHFSAFVCVSTGGLILAYSTARYYHVQKQLQSGNFPLNRKGVAVIVVGATLATMASLKALLDKDYDRDSR